MISIFSTPIQTLMYVKISKYNEDILKKIVFAVPLPCIFWLGR